MDETILSSIDPSRIIELETKIKPLWENILRDPQTYQSADMEVYNLLGLTNQPPSGWFKNFLVAGSLGALLVSGGMVLKKRLKPQAQSILPTTIEPQPEPEPTVLLQPQPQSQSQPEPEPTVLLQPQPQSQSQPEPEPTVLLQPQPQSQSQPEPEPTVLLQPQPQSQSQPEPEPTVLLKPEPTEDKPKNTTNPNKEIEHKVDNCYQELSNLQRKVQELTTYVRDSRDKLQQYVKSPQQSLAVELQKEEEDIFQEMKLIPSKIGEAIKNILEEKTQIKTQIEQALHECQQLYKKTQAELKQSEVNYKQCKEEFKTRFAQEQTERQKQQLKKEQDQRMIALQQLALEKQKLMIDRENNQKLDELKQKLNTATLQIKTIQTELEEIQKEKDSLKRLLEACRKLNSKLKTENIELKTQNETCQAQIKTTRETCKKDIEQNEQIAKENFLKEVQDLELAYKTRLNECTNKMKLTQHELEALLEQNKILTDEKKQLTENLGASQRANKTAAQLFLKQQTQMDNLTNFTIPTWYSVFVLESAINEHISRNPLSPQYTQQADTFRFINEEFKKDNINEKNLDDFITDQMGADMTFKSLFVILEQIIFYFGTKPDQEKINDEYQRLYLRTFIFLENFISDQNEDNSKDITYITSITNPFKQRLMTRRTPVKRK